MDQAYGHPNNFAVKYHYHGALYFITQLIILVSIPDPWVIAWMAFPSRSHSVKSGAPGILDDLLFSGRLAVYAIGLTLSWRRFVRT